MREILTIIPIALLNSILGLTVLVRNRKNPINITFFLMVHAVVAWIVCNYLANIQMPSALIWTKLTFVSGLSVSVFLLLFSVFFTEKKMKPLTISIALICYVLYSIFILVSPTVVSSISYIPTGTGVNTGPLYMSFPIGFFLLVGIAISIIVQYYRHSTAIKRTQVKFMMFGLLISAIFASLTNVVYPAFFHNDTLSQFGPYAMIIFVGFSTYAIVKHRLMDIRMVVARSVAYLLLISILAGFYAGSVLGIQALFFPNAAAGFNFTEGAVRTVIAVIMVFLFQPLRRWITKVTDSIFFKEQYNTEDLLDTFAHTVGSTIILIEMLYKSIDILTKQIRITRAMIVVFSETGAVMESQSIGYKKAPKLVAKDLIALAHDGVLVADELDENSKYKKLLAEYESSVAVPLKTESGAEGVLLLGEKQSGDMFSQNDLKVFEIIAPELGVAITNAKSYEKIERFNVTLRQEVKKATHELEKKNEQLRELDKAKDEFISMASHQLRTPLTAIKGYLSMLLEGDAGEIKVSQYDFVNEAFSGANRMVGLINDLLNVSRMETGRFFLEPVEVDMEKLVNEEYKQLTNHAKEKGLKFEVNIKGKIPHIWVDETKIRQVVMNFMDNALYYTTQGTVTVTLSADKKNVTFEVRDTGIGVPKSAQRSLFTKFYRADNARHVRPDGTGLGIYLAKRVMDDHNGEVIFHSVEGKGSTFGFKIPIKSELKIKRVSAPQPGSHTSGPGIGELAAGVGVPVETLEATQAVGIEAPLPDSPDAKDLEKAVEEIKK